MYNWLFHTIRLTDSNIHSYSSNSVKISLFCFPCLHSCYETPDDYDDDFEKVIDLVRNGEKVVISVKNGIIYSIRVNDILIFLSDREESVKIFTDLGKKVM